MAGEAGDPDVRRGIPAAEGRQEQKCNQEWTPRCFPGTAGTGDGATSLLRKCTDHLRQQLFNLMLFETLTVEHLGLFLCNVYNKELICRTYKKQT